MTVSKEPDTVSRFGVCIFCAYREGALLTPEQETCDHDLAMVVRYSDGSVRVA